METIPAGTDEVLSWTCVDCVTTEASAMPPASAAAAKSHLRRRGEPRPVGGLALPDWMRPSMG